MSSDVPGGPRRAFLDVSVVDSTAPRARVAVRGELDLATAPRLEDTLRALVHEGYRDLDVDLDGVTFCDVAGLNALLRSHGDAVRDGGRLLVSGRCRPLRLMMEVLKPADAFETTPEDHPPGS